MATTNNNDPRLTRLCAEIADTQQKLAQLVAELERLLTGQAGIGQRLKAASAAFATAWSHRYASGDPKDYVWVAWARDAKKLKDLLAIFSVEELVTRMQRYIADDDAFLVRQKHPLLMFVSKVNQYGTAFEGKHGAEFALVSDAQAPVDCRHTPRCRTDADCTAKRMADLRGAR